MCSCLGILRSHVLDEVHHSAGVAPLVVVPAHHLHEGRVQHDASLRIEGAGDGAGFEISGHKRLISVAKVALHVTLRSLLHLGADLLVGGLLLQLHREVNNGDVDGRDTQGHARQLALHIWDHLGHRLGSTSAGWDDVSRTRTASTPVLLGGAIHSGLGCSHGVAGGHQATLDAPLLLEHTDCRSKSVGGAGGAGHALHGWIIGVLVHAHHDGVGIILGRSREDHLLGPGFEVALHLLSGEEDARAFADVLGTVLCEGNLRGVTGVGQSNLLAVDHKGVSISLHGSIVLSMNPGRPKMTRRNST